MPVKIRSLTGSNIHLFSMLLLWANLAACASTNNTTGGNTAEKPESVQVIIAFNSVVTDAQDVKIVASLSRILGSEVTFLRLLSGQAALYAIRWQGSEEKLIEKLKELGATENIKYAELDRKRRIQGR